MCICDAALTSLENANEIAAVLQEAVERANNYTFSPSMCMFALSTVIQCAIQSYYPITNDAEVKENWDSLAKMFNCTIYPRDVVDGSAIDYVHIFRCAAMPPSYLIRTTKKSENYFISELKYIAMDNVQLNDIFIYEETSLEVVEQLVATGHYGSAKNMEEILDIAKRASIAKRRIELLERSFYDQSAEVEYLALCCEDFGVGTTVEESSVKVEQNEATAVNKSIEGTTAVIQQQATENAISILYDEIVAEVVDEMVKQVDLVNIALKDFAENLVVLGDDDEPDQLTVGSGDITETQTCLCLNDVSTTVDGGEQIFQAQHPVDDGKITKDLFTQVVGEIKKGVSTLAVCEITEDLPTQVVCEISEDLPTEVDGKITKDLSTLVVGEITEDLSTLVDVEVTKDLPTLVDGEITEDLSTQVVGEITEDLPTLVDGEITEDLLTQVDVEITEDLPTQVVGEITEDLPTQVVGEITKDLCIQVDGEITEDLPTQVVGEITEDLPTQVVGEITKDLSTQVDGEITKDLSTEVVGEITEDLPAQVVGEITEDLPTQVDNEISKDLPTQVDNEISKDLPTTIVSEITKDPSTVGDNEIIQAHLTVDDADQGECLIKNDLLVNVHDKHSKSTSVDDCAQEIKINQIYSKEDNCHHSIRCGNLNENVTESLHDNLSLTTPSNGRKLKKKKGIFSKIIFLLFQE
ncbi:uncharacterized protein LOC124443489 [Xenia sp. Carnegie-2017]|uniref:uncharacterized protein LOC124443489 n=1 Tax=Xenia sp. Carnegie-2017 TaxID=2897299 RepID=UPI001F049448|nr:uncharacterized protein LOC124443489 [Xenia sp. Carnegie-2017]